MYIWIGCKLPEEFEREIRARCRPLGEELGLDMSGFSLLQHISLKISFDAGDGYGEILDYLESLLKKEKRFYVNPAAIEAMGNILWLSFRENGTLRRLHNVLDKELKNRFAIPQHLFDKAFAFHSTLFLGEPEKVSRAMTVLENFALPSKLSVDTFLLGVSENGKNGTYRVVRWLDAVD